MKKKEVLGKGLAALIPDIEKVEEDLHKRLFYCGIEEIKPNLDQPRKNFNKNTISELAKSLKSKGMIQPLVVRRAKRGGYELIVGERRWRAAQEAGLSDVPIIFKDVSDSESMELSLIENIQRENLNPIDEAAAYKNILSFSNLTQEELSLRLGKNRSTIANYLRLLSLPELIRGFLKDYSISVGHAIALLSINNKDEQIALCKKIISDTLSVRQIENIIKNLKGNNKKNIIPDNNVLFFPIIDDLIRVLGTKVKIVSRKKGGKIEIKFNSEDDLNRIIEIIKK